MEECLLPYVYFKRQPQTHQERRQQQLLLVAAAAAAGLMLAPLLQLNSQNIHAPSLVIDAV
jgi:hypothetical protein